MHTALAIFHTSAYKPVLKQLLMMEYKRKLLSSAHIFVTQAGCVDVFWAHVVDNPFLEHELLLLLLLEYLSR